LGEYTRQLDDAKPEKYYSRKTKFYAVSLVNQLIFCFTFEVETTHQSIFYISIFMKKVLILALGAATLSLGSCSRGTCPAYSSAKAASAPITASTATSVVSQ
jgi:hypothetical protein